jgi:hypothetical protein
MPTGLEGFATAINQTTDVVCAYASGEKTIPAQTVDAWIKIGSFTVPEPVAARLVVLGCAFGCEVGVKLFGPGPVANSLATLTLEAESEARSGVFTLVPNVIYLVAASAVNPSVGAANLGSVTTVSLGNP